MDEKECSTCRWHDPTDGYCLQLEIYVHDHDGEDCEDYRHYRKRKQEEV